MRTDRETQRNIEGPWERHEALGWGIPMQFGKTGRPWGGEFLCNFEYWREDDKINKQRKEPDPSIPVPYY